MPKKVTYHLGPLPVSSLVEYCPFCEKKSQIKGKRCKECFPEEKALAEDERGVVNRCPLCGELVSGVHEC